MPSFMESFSILVLVQVGNKLKSFVKKKSFHLEMMFSTCPVLFYFISLTKNTTHSSSHK